MAATYVIFDMDGLMFDTERLFIDSVRFAVAPALGTSFEEEKLCMLIGLNSAAIAELFPRLFGAQTPIKEFFELGHAWIDGYIREKGIPVKPGLYELLGALRRSGARLAMATSTARERADAYLASAGLENVFDVIVTGDMVTRSKPEPDIFLRAASELGAASPEECFVLEDSKNGLLAALAGGFRAIIVPDIAILPEGFEKSCFAVLHDLSEAVPILCG